jgi:hypothetical protein
MREVGLAAICAVALAAHAAGSATIRSAPVATLYEEELQRCGDRVNHYRSSVHRGVLKRSPVLEAFAVRAAANDGLAHIAHQYFKRTNGGGVSRAENAIPWWSLRAIGGVRAAVDAGLQMMWDEGPRGRHYINMAGPYTQIGCGIFVNDDEVTIVQEFR